MLKRIIIIILALVIALSAVSIAGAQDPDRNRPQRPRRVVALAHIVLDTAATSVGLTTQELLQSTETGQTLSDAIVANGGDPAQVAADAQIAATEAINAAVSENKISQEEAAEMLSGLPTAIDMILNQPRPQLPDESRIGNGLVSAAVYKEAAESLDMTIRELVVSAEEGQTLSEVITANGGDPVQVAADAATTITEQVNTAAENGRITPETAADILANLDAAISETLNGAVSQRPNLRNQANPERPAFSASVVVEGALLRATIDALGVTAMEVVEARQNGQSLAEFITANGGDPNQVATDAISAITERITTAQENGQITPEEAEEILADLETRVNDALNSTEPLQPRGSRRGERSGFGSDGSNKGVLEQ